MVQQISIVDAVEASFFEQEIDVRLQFFAVSEGEDQLIEHFCLFFCQLIRMRRVDRRKALVAQSIRFLPNRHRSVLVIDLFQQTAVFHAVLRVLTDQTVLEL